MALTADLRHVLHLAEMQAVGGANGDTGRFETRINSVLTIIAFDHFSCFWIPLGCTPGAGRDARLAPYAQARFDVNNAILGPPAHGAGRAGRNAPRVFAVKTRHEHIRRLRQSVHHLRPYLDDLAWSGPDRKVLVRLADDLTGVASDAVFRILEKVVLTHRYPPDS